jgi:hypothetical protein
VIRKPRRARAAYREMLEYYAAKTLIAWFAARPAAGFGELVREVEKAPAERVRDWVNLGGQIVPAFRVDALRAEIREGKCRDWHAIHGAYDEMAAEYPRDLLYHAWAVLAWLQPAAAAHPCAEKAGLEKTFRAVLETRRKITGGIYQSRAKDFHDPFRRITYRNRAEMEAVAGRPEDNPFIRRSQESLAAFEREAASILARL